MKFENIKYVERIDKHGRTLGLYRPGGFFVFKVTMALAWKRVNENWANIDWTRRQSAETMIGCEVWHMQPNGARQALGRCIRLFIQHDMLPRHLVLAKTRNGKPYKGGKRLYVQAHSVDALPVMDIPASCTVRNREVLSNVDWSALQKSTLPITTGGPLQ